MSGNFPSIPRCRNFPQSHEGVPPSCEATGHRAFRLQPQGRSVQVGFVLRSDCAFATHRVAIQQLFKPWFKLLWRKCLFLVSFEREAGFGCKETLQPTVANSSQSSLTLCHHQRLEGLLTLWQLLQLPPRLLIRSYARWAKLGGKLACCGIHFAPVGMDETP